jgi:hypothetical protein
MVENCGLRFFMWVLRVDESSLKCETELLSKIWFNGLPVRLPSSAEFHSLLSKTRQSAHTLEAATKELPLRSKQAFTMSTSARRRLLRDFKRCV